MEQNKLLFATNFNNDSGVQECSGTSSRTSNCCELNQTKENHNNSEATSAIDLSEDENKSIQEQTSEIFELNDCRQFDLPKRFSNRLSSDSGSTYEIIESPESIGDGWNQSIKLNTNNGDEESSSTVNGKPSDLKCDINVEERDTFSPVNSEDNVPCYQLNENTLKLGHNFTVADIPEYEEDNNLFRRRKYEHLRSSTKEEKQRQNEEIVILESSSVSSETGSWESLFPNNNQTEIKDCCKLFLTNEIKYCSNNNDSCDNSSKIDEDKNPSPESEEQNKPSCSVKACFIDASSLLDDTEVPYANVIGPKLPQVDCFRVNPELENIKFVSIESDKHFDKNLSPEPKQIEKCETVNVLFEKCKPKSLTTTSDDEYQINKGLHNTNSVIMDKYDQDELAKSRQEYEKKQGNMVFKNSIQQFSGHLISPKIAYSDDNYSDFSLPSVYSNESDSNNSHNDTYDYGIRNYQLSASEPETIIFPDTPHNSIIQITNMEQVKKDKEPMNGNSSKIITKCIRKCDESAPILSSGFISNQCNSPPVRKNESCPIISGGSVIMHLEDEIKSKIIDKPKNPSTLASWIVDMSDTSSMSSNDNVSLEQKDSSSGSKNGSLGYFVSLNDSNSKENLVKKIHTPLNSSQDSLKKSTGFFVDLSDNESTSSAKVSNVSQPPEQDKKNIFSMFIDFGDKKTVTRREPFSLTSKLTNSLQQKKIMRSGDIEMSKSVTGVSNSEVSNNNNEQIQCSSDIRPDEKGNIIARRSIPKIDSKRHSWNTSNNQDSCAEKLIPDIEREYKRSISLSTEKGIMNILDKLPLISKTSSMSIDSSLSPFDDFSCTKSDISIFSNNSGPSAHSSLDCNLSINENGQRRRRCDVKINETFDKSSQGSITDGIFSKDLSPTSTTTETDDVTFQNDINEKPEENNMTTVIEKKEEFNGGHTMETLHATIEKQKQLLETVTENVESASNVFVKLSDMDKPVTKFELHSSAEVMSNSTGSRVARLFQDSKSFNVTTADRYSWNMSRSTGNPLVNLATSVENTRSLSRLFPHLTKAFSNSLPSNVGYNSMEKSINELSDYMMSEISYTSSVSSRSGFESADESSLSLRQPRRLGEDLLKMFLQEIGTDVTVEVGNRKMRAHKCILRSRCQYFAAILAGSWVQSAGNIINLPGYSYGVVHFALCHIYSGAAHPPEGISLMELAGLADLLGLEGLKEVTSHALKTNYCHNFHKPCSGCIDGIIQVLPVSLNHGLDELYRKCLKWVCRHYVKVWPTRSFSQLSYDIIYRSRQQLIAHMNSENVLNIYLDSEHILTLIGPCKWANNVDHVLRDIIENALSYISDHFASLIASDSFLSLGHGNSWNISRLEHLLLRTASTLTPDQACKSYQRCTRLNTVLGAKIITVPNGNMSEHSLEHSHQEEMDWNEEFIRLVSSIVSAVEQCLTRQCARAMKVNSWQRMDAELRKKIQKLACLSEPIIDRKSRTTNKLSYNHVSAPYQSRNHDLHQVRLAIAQAQNRRSISTDNKQYRASTHTQTNAEKFLQTFQPTTDNKSVQANHDNLKENRILKTTSRAHVNPETLVINKSKALTHKRSLSDKVEDKNHNKEKIFNPIKLNDIKPRYLEPKKNYGPKIPINIIPKGKRISSTESSTRTSSPAGLKPNKKITDSNISLDSLTSPAKASKNLKIAQDKLSIDSLKNSSSKSSVKTDRTNSHECLLRVNTNVVNDNKTLQLKTISKSNPMINKENIAKPLVGNKLGKSKSTSCQNTSGTSPSTVVRTMNNLTFSPRDGYKSRIATKITTEQSPTVKRSFLSAKSKEILLKKNQNNNNKTAIPLAKSISASPVLSEKKILNKSSSVSNVSVRKSINPPTTLHLRKTAKVIPTLNKITPIVNKNNKIGLNSVINGERKKEEISNEICVEFIPATNEKFESKLERSSTFLLKESSDIPTLELQIIE